jgi:glycosyltransferase involved in cell wall biosynthesis
MPLRLRSLAARAYREVTYRLTGEDPRQFLDLADLPRLNKLLASAGLPPLTAPPMPDAVLGERALRVYELSRELRDGLPLALTPAGREGFLNWAIHHSSGEHRVSAAEALALLAHTDKLPDRGLELSYRLHPAWQQAVPDALAGGWAKLTRFVRERYGIRGRWLAEAKKEDPTPRPPPRAEEGEDEGGCLSPPLRLGEGAGGWGFGTNVVAHFEYASGLQQAAFGLVDALHAAGVRTSLRDLPVTFRPDPLAPRRLGVEEFDTTIHLAAVNTFPDDWYPKAGLFPRPGVRRIAVWYWEMEDVPAEWVPRLGWADEVWAPTRFIADTFRKYVNVPVVTMLPGVVLPAFEPKPRSAFGLRDDRFAFLFTFDLFSTLARKNPLGLIAAYRKAFRRDEPVDLVLKVSRGDEMPADFAVLKTACDDSGVTLLNAVLPRGDLLALMACCDSYVSLHRSEGLGLGLAEAMLLGKPVIGTGYSGNLDFMTADNSYLVRCGRVPCAADAPPYQKGFVWGEPDLDHAAELMRRVYENRAETTARGERAKRELTELLSLEAYSRRVGERMGG